MKKIILFSFFISVLFTFYAQTQTLNDSLVSRYTFNLSNIDDTVSSKNGNAFNNVTYPLGGFDGARVARFNGLNYGFAVVQDSIIPLNGDYTISFWFEVDSFSTNRQTLLSSRKDTSGREAGGIEFFIFEGTNELNIFGRTANSSAVYGLNSDSLQNQILYHAALTHKSNSQSPNEVILYLNGVSVDTAYSSSSNYAQPNDVWLMGADLLRSGSSVSTWRYLEGILDDIRFYNRLLSGGEISQLYNARSTTSINDLANSNSDLTIYPNPVGDQLVIKQNGLTIQELNVFNLSGQQVQNFIPSSSTSGSYDVSALPSGIYIIQAIANDRIINKKIVKN